MGEWKPLMAFRGSTIIQTVVATALQACPRVLLVTGHRGGELAGLFGGEARVTLIHNAGWERGMFSSLQLGAARVRTRRFFITLGDKPWITSDVYRALLNGEEGGAVVFPVHRGQRGHPVLVPGELRPAIAAADPVRGSMRLIAESCSVREVPWPDESILRDADTPEDLHGPG